MPDILHRIGVRAASPQAVYGALTTLAGLASWWTREVTSATAPGGVIMFRFGERGFVHVKVLELVSDARVLWEVVDGPQEWVGTRISMDLRQEDEHTIVLFKHAGWREPVEFMHHCSTKWAIFLMSLKTLVETGAGAPYPDDPRIDNWN